MLGTRKLCATAVRAATQSLLSSPGLQSPQHPCPGTPVGLGDSMEELCSSPQIHHLCYGKGRDSDTL